MIFPFIILTLSLILLYFSAEITLNSAEKIGVALGLSPLVIGLIIIAFGTSLPEFFVSHIAVLNDNPDMAFGNIVGSNIANLLLILGISGLFVNLSFNSIVLRIQLFIHFVVILLFGAVLVLGVLNWITLLVFSVVFLYFLKISLRRPPEVSQEISKEKFVPFDLLKILIGFGGLYGSGELLVYSVVEVGTFFNISSYVISATVVAFGTSAPELITSLLMIKRKSDVNMIVGNIIGSNIFNISFVLGSLGVYGLDFKRDFRVEFFTLVFLSLFMLFLHWRKNHFGKISAMFFLFSYVGILYFWQSV